MNDLLHLGGGVDYATQATVASDGAVRNRTLIRNAGSEAVAYELDKMVVAAADGGLLRLVGTEMEPTVHTVDGGFCRVHPIDAGRQYVIVRRYELADGLRRGRDVLLVARLSLSVVVHVGGREVRVALRLDEVR